MKTRKRKAMRAHGAALVINPRRKATPKRRSNPRRKTVKNLKSVTVRYNGSRRRPARRRSVGALRINPLVVRGNPRKRKSTRKRKTRSYTVSESRRGASKRRRNPAKRRTAPRVMKAKRNPHKRRNGLRVRRNPMMSKLEKLPVVGPFLAATVGMVPSVLVGAVSVEPQLLVNSAVARVWPNMPASLAHALSGAILGGATAALLPKTGLVKKQTARDLGLAMAAAGGGVGYYLMKTQADSTVEDNMGALRLAGVGFGNPVATLVDGLAGVGTLHGASHPPALGFAEAVYPANAMPSSNGYVIGGAYTGNV